MIQYRYENGLLTTVCHVDEGITTYHYDEPGNILQIIDQNGNAYVRNEYDEKGCVIAQYYLNNTKSTIPYDEEHRENIIYLEELNRTEHYCYDENYLVAHTYFDDGTCIQYEYDAWRNRIVEQDRKGFVTKHVYDVYGNPVEKILPSGQERKYEYTKGHQLQSKKANTGEEQWFAYNDQGFVIEEKEKIAMVLPMIMIYEKATSQKLCLHKFLTTAREREKLSKHDSHRLDNRKLRTHYPDETIERYFYDPNGNLTKKCI